MPDWSPHRLTLLIASAISGNKSSLFLPRSRDAIVLSFPSASAGLAVPECTSVHSSPLSRALNVLVLCPARSPFQLASWGRKTFLWMALELITEMGSCKQIFSASISSSMYTKNIFPFFILLGNSLPFIKTHSDLLIQFYFSTNNICTKQHKMWVFLSEEKYLQKSVVLKSIW